MPETPEKPRLRLLLNHFAFFEDDRALADSTSTAGVLLLVVRGTIAADWGREVGRGLHTR